MQGRLISGISNTILYSSLHGKTRSITLNNKLALSNRKDTKIYALVLISVSECTYPSFKIDNAQPGLVILLKLSGDEYVLSSSKQNIGAYEWL